MDMSKVQNSAQKRLRPTQTAQPDVGAKYEVSVATLVAAALSNNAEVEKYHVFTNLKEAHPFDDVVARVFFKGENVPYGFAMQLKHLGKGETIDVEKYLKGYKKIFDAGGLKTIGDIDVNNIHFCYFCIKNVRTVDYTLCVHKPTTKSWDSTLSLQNCYKLSYSKPPNETDEKRDNFLKRFYLYLNQPDTNKIKENIKNLCQINDATDIIKYVDKYFEKGVLWQSGLSKQIFEAELLRIRFSDNILSPTDIIQFSDSQTAIWNKLTAQYNVTIVKAEANIEKSLYGCIANMLNRLLDNIIVDWNTCKTNSLDSNIVSAFRNLFTSDQSGRIRHWIDPPTTLKSLIIELWKTGDLPLILKGDNDMSALQNYRDLNKNYIVITDDVTSKRDELKGYHLKTFTRVSDITCVEMREELLKALSVSLQGKKPTTLYSIVEQNKELAATLSCSYILHLLENRKAYLSKECLDGDHSLIFLIEDPTSSAQYNIDDICKVGSNITMQCRPSELSKYRKQIQEHPKLQNYNVYHCAASSENENFTLIDGNKSLLGDFFVDQYEENVYVLDDNPVPILGATLKTIQDGYIPRFLRTAVISRSLFDSPTKGICLFSGDLNNLDANIRENIVDMSSDMIQQPRNVNVFISIKNEDINKYWEEASKLKCPLLYIRIEGSEMELRRCKNWKGLSDHISYNGRKISEENLLEEIADGITVLSGEAGIGKSSLLRALFKKHSTGKYVVFYNLVDYGRYLEQSNLVPTNNSLDFIFNQWNSTKHKDIISSLYKNKQNLLVLLDAFDEVLPVHREKILNFIGNIAESNVQIIIASRLIADYLLIDNFGSQTVKVDVLGKYDCIEYFKNCNLSTLELNSIPLEFLENPLYLNFLKITFENHVSLTSINKLTLYDAILNIKLDQYFDKHFSKAHEPDKEYLLKPVLELHGRLALVSTLGDHVAAKFLDWDRERKLTNKLKLGIIVFIDEDGYPTFVHKTFAEYLTAKWIIRNITKDVGKNIYQEMMNQDKLDLLNILYEGLELHEAVEYGNLDEVEIFAKKPANLLAIDMLGRTALHVAAINYQRTERFLENFKLYNIVNIIVQQMRENKCDFMQSNLHIKWDWLYHIHPGNALPFMCNNTSSVLDIYINTVKRKLEKGDAVFTTSLFEEFDEIFLIAVERRSINMIRDLLFIKNYSTNSNFDHLYRSCFCSDSEISNTITSNLKVTNGLTPLHLACVYGSVEVASRFVELNSDINASDEFNCTPLYYSIISPDEVAVDMTKLLLRAGANVNKANQRGLSPLSIAVRMKNLFVTKLLLENGASANYIKEDMEAPILVAVNEGNLDMVELLFGYQANINNVDKNGASALMHAAINGNANIVKLLLNKGAMVNDQDENSSVLLAAAKMRKNVLTVEVLLGSGANLNSTDADGRTPLFIATECHNSDIMKLLLENGANVNSTDADGRTPLFIAAEYGNSDIMKLLLENGANVNSITANGESPLLANCARLNFRSVKLLLEYGAEVSIVTPSGKTPIIAASETGCVEIVKLLLEYGADVNDTTNSGDTPLSVASQQGNLGVVQLLLEKGADVKHITIIPRDLDMVKLLLEKGADVNKVTKNGESPLFFASARYDIDIVKLLLEYGADVNSADADGKTPIFIAAAKSEHHIVKLLLETGANINSVTKNGDTPLSVASKQGRLKIVKVLLEYGANVDDVSTSSELLCSAAWRGSSDIVRLLLERGIEVNKSRWFGTPVLSHALKSKCLEMVRLIIKAGANVNRFDKFGLTPLSHAAEVNDPDIVKLLLDSGADVNEGCPLYIAASKKDLTVAKLLLAADANVNNKNQETGETAIFNAARYVNLHMMKLLLEHNADVNIKTFSGTPLLFNVLFEVPFKNEARLDIVKLLLDNNAIVTEECLEIAVEYKNRPVVKLLTKKK